MDYLNGHFYSLNQFLKESFGEKLYKISLDGGFTCPNRDGTVGIGGCIFCSRGGSGEFAVKISDNISQQIETAKALVSHKTKSERFIAYFQSFTNTYAPVEYLEKLYYQIVKRNDIAALSVATRPDCLDDDVIELLDRLNHIKPVWVELGLQTIHEKTAKYIRRGYTLDVYDDAVRRLRNKNITVITHVILGLPFESHSQMIQTVRYVGSSGIQGIKLQLLHVLKNTDLEDEYAKGKFSTMLIDEYIDLLCDCIESLPPDIVIHRLTGDGAKKILVAPLWSGDKKKVLNTINREFDRRNILQGRKAELRRH